MFLAEIRFIALDTLLVHGLEPQLMLSSRFSHWLPLLGVFFDLRCPDYLMITFFKYL